MAAGRICPPRCDGVKVPVCLPLALPLSYTPSLMPASLIGWNLDPLMHLRGHFRRIPHGLRHLPPEP